MRTLRVCILLLVFSFATDAFSESLNDKIHEILPITAFESAHREYLTYINQDDSNVSLTGDIEESNDSNDEDKEYRLLSGSFSLDEPVPITPDSFFIIGLELAKERYQKQSLSLQTIAAEIGFGTFLNKNLLAIAAFEPGIYSDLNGALHARDIFVPGAFEFHYRVSDQFSVNSGVLARDIDSLDSYVPLVGFVASSPTRQWTLHALLPVEARLSYQYREPFELYLHWQNGGYRYRVDGRIPGENRTTLEVNEMRYGAGIRTKVSKYFSVVFEGGIVRAASFELIDAGDDRKEYLAAGGYGTVSFEWGW